MQHPPLATTRIARNPSSTAGARRLAMLKGPVLPTMLRLAAPMVAVFVAQTFVSVAETWYVSFLGTDALAGVALVFPVLLLMTTMSNGGIGGGVASAIARATGAGRGEDADALVWHALVLAALFGAAFTAAALLFGPALYRALGGEGPALTAALTYSTFVFAGAVPIWMTNLMTSALRGVGNVRVPALVVLVGAAVLVPASPLLIFGLGPVPRLGVAGAGTAVAIYYLGATLVLLRYLAAGRGGLVLRRRRLEWRLFRAILGVGLLSALGTLQASLTIVLVTGAVGLFGIDALAGYGAASRLDTVLIPLMFGLGTAVVTMVGVNVGAGQQARARRIALTGALLAAGVTEAVGLVAAFAPRLWMGVFTHDPAVLVTGALYLRHAAPAYGAVGFGLLLYFAAQGFGRVAVPVLGGFARLLIAAGLGWLAVAWFGAGLEALFSLVAAASLAFGAINLAVLRRQ